MAGVPFHYLDFRSFAYETEELERVETALRTFLPPDTTLERAETAGHHGDRILILSTRLELADEIRYVLDRVTDAAAFDAVVAELADRVDEDCAFFVRFDKQRAFRDEEIALGPGIQFRGKVEAYPATRKGAITNLREYLFEDQ